MRRAVDGRQRGLATVEFAVVGLVFFTLVFGIVELGRGLFLMNTLTEVTRRAARVAAVCPVNHPAIGRVGVFGSADGDGTSPLLDSLTSANVAVDYLDARGTVIADPVAGFRNIRYVRTRITNLRVTLLVLGFGRPFSYFSPALASTQPRESLGVPAQGDGALCFGAAT
jgi:hypothetical protein